MLIHNSDIIDKLMHIYNIAGFRDNSIWTDRITGPLYSRDPKPFSIVHGGAGKYLFTFELYKFTQEKAILKDLRNHLRELNKYIYEHKSNNYGLLNGKFGTAYLFLQFFKFTQEEEFLELAVEITKAHWKEGSTGLMAFEKCGFFDGIAGILLFYLQLYDVIKSEWLLHYIQYYTLHLIGKAELMESGVYWMNDLFEKQPETIWPCGNSGIAFCFLELGRYFNNDSLSSLAHHALSCEDDLSQRVQVRSTASNTIGQDLVRLYAAFLKGTPFSLNISNSLDSLADSPHNRDISYDISNGVAGLGVAFKEAYCLTKNAAYLDSAREMSLTLLKYVEQETKRPIKRLDFFYGLSGIGYSLLKIADEGLSPSLILPRTQNDARINYGNVGCHCNKMNIDRTIINKLLFEANFTDTFSILKKSFQPELNLFLTNDKLFINPKVISEWVSKLEKYKLKNHMEEDLAEVFEREVIGQKLKSAQPDFLVDNNIETAKSIEKILGLTEKELLTLRLVISNKVFILRREESIDLSLSVNSVVLETILKFYGSRSYFLQVNRYNEIEKGALNIDRLYLDQFMCPISVNAVVDKVISFVMSQNEEVIASLLEVFQANDNDHLKTLLSVTILHSIRWLLILDILVVSTQ